MKWRFVIGVHMYMCVEDIFLALSFHVFYRKQAPLFWY